MTGTGLATRRAYFGVLMGAPARLIPASSPRGALGFFLGQIAVRQRRGRLSRYLALRMRSRLLDTEPVENDTVRPSALGRSSRRGQSPNGHTRPVLSEPQEAQLMDRGRTKAGLPNDCTDCA